MIGFETIGNATLIVHDGAPVLATDPWITGGAYFGSWGLSHEVPAEQLAALRRCPTVWISHGHPDHLSAESLAFLTGKRVLLPDHVGGRIRGNLSDGGFDVIVMKDREWYEISRHVRVACVTDYFQDAILLADVNGRLVVNINDATDRGWGRFVRRTIARYPKSFMLKTLGYGDIDMMNYFREDGTRILPGAAARRPVGRQAQFYAELFGVTDVVPFSSFHAYQRTDSGWANAYTTPLSAYSEGFASRRAILRPPFLRYDCVGDDAQAIMPPPRAGVMYEPSKFGDDWDEPLESGDRAALTSYFRSIEHLVTHVDFVNCRVGGRDNISELRGRGFSRGVTFEVPRASLLTAVRYQVFDDLLIGNFMRTTLHGDWGPGMLHTHFTPWVAKFGDNGGARTHDELQRYLRAYRERAPLAFLLHRMESESERRLRVFATRDSLLFKCAKRTYFFVKRMV